MSELTDAVDRIKAAADGVSTTIANLEAKAAALDANPEVATVLADVQALATTLESLAAHDPAVATVPESPVPEPIPEPIPEPGEEPPA